MSTFFKRLLWSLWLFVWWVFSVLILLPLLLTKGTLKGAYDGFIDTWKWETPTTIKWWKDIHK